MSPRGFAAATAALALGACGGAQPLCPDGRPPSRLVVDGEEVPDPSPYDACEPVRLELEVRSYSIRGTLTVADERRWLSLRFETWEPALPARFDLEVPHTVRDWPSHPIPWATAGLLLERGAGPLRSSRGTATLHLDDGRVVVSMEGRLARRDGLERPFRARFEAPVEITCDPGGFPAERCAPFERRDPAAAGRQTGPAVEAISGG